MDKKGLQEFLDRKVEEYNRTAFIPDDPVSIPHQFAKQQDIEISGFFAAIFSWGNRKTIIQKSRALMQLMDQAPHDFILHHKEKDLRKLLGFKHRTFNDTDLLYFVRFLHSHYSQHDSLEDAFLIHASKNALAEPWAGSSLNAFHHYFFTLDEAPPRTFKHIAAPAKQSTCKRLNMFLRWMVRRDSQGVDFGIWNRISPADLICPIDVHVARVAKRLGLLSRKPIDWEAGLELTAHLRTLDSTDPVKYDFALFGLGVVEHY